MASDPTTWPDVWLALAGAPIGAAITVLGVALTNSHNSKTQRELLAGQADQQRERMDFDLRAENQRDTLKKRGEIYVEVLKHCAWAIKLGDWAGANELPDGVMPISNEEVSDFVNSLPTTRYLVDVHCSAEVRAQFAVLEDAAHAVDETSGDEPWDALTFAASALRNCVIEAAVADRSGAIASDGLGGM
jgi:hypothetical protein